MKNKLKQLGIIAIVTIIVFSITSCEEEDPCANCLSIGTTGPGGGKIFYHNHSGFTVTGTGSFTAYYLEVAPNNQGKALAWSSYDFRQTYIPTEKFIGTGKANTASILSIDANAPAAKACNDYRNNNKADWFLPSADELLELSKQKNHCNITDSNLWSSTQSSNGSTFEVYFPVGTYSQSKNTLAPTTVRAIRAF